MTDGYKFSKEIALPVRVERDVEPTDPDAIKPNDVECPYCQAKPQQDCSRARSRVDAPEKVYPHRERVEAAVRAEAERLMKTEAGLNALDANAGGFADVVGASRK